MIIFPYKKTLTALALSMTMAVSAIASVPVYAGETAADKNQKTKTQSASAKQDQTQEKLIISAGAGIILDCAEESMKSLNFSAIEAGEASSETVSSISMNSTLDADGDGLIAGYYNLGVAKVDNYLNVRKEPDQNSDLVGKLPKNGGCEVRGESGDWYHIRSGKVDGYVNKDYLLTGVDAVQKAMKVMTLKAVVTTTTLFVREEANSDSACLTMVPIEEELDVVSGTRGDAWVKVAVDDDEGWISTDYANISEQLDKAVTMTELRYGQGVSDVRVNLVNYSKQFLGNPYVWGGTSLTHGADCSGYVMQIFKKFGVSLPRTSRQQARCGTAIKASEARPGDLFFYAKKGTINHVAIYIGGGQVINASSPRTGIKISNAYYRTPAAVRRVLKD